VPSDDQRRGLFALTLPGWRQRHIRNTSSDTFERGIAALGELLEEQLTAPSRELLDQKHTAADGASASPRFT
jgi:hypothetical protein